MRARTEHRSGLEAIAFKFKKGTENPMKKWKNFCRKYRMFVRRMRKKVNRSNEELQKYTSQRIVRFNHEFFNVSTTYFRGL